MRSRCSNTYRQAGTGEEFGYSLQDVWLTRMMRERAADMVGNSAVGVAASTGPEQVDMRTRTPTHVNVGSALGSGRCAAEFA